MLVLILDCNHRYTCEILKFTDSCILHAGISYERINDLQAAEAHFTEALETDPLHRNARSHLRDVVDWQHPKDPSRWWSLLP